MADTLDIITLAEAKTALNIDSASTTHDTELAVWITTISRRVDAVCGPVVNRTITSEQHRGGRAVILPRYAPVSSVTTITEYSGTTSQALAAENLAATTGNDYWLDPDTDLIYRRSSGNTVSFAPTRVVLTYVAGRAANTTSVDARFKGAAGAILRRAWTREAGAWARGDDPFATPDTTAFFRAVDPMIAEFLSDERRVPGIA